MYKNKEELTSMNLREIAEYLVELEHTDEAVRDNKIEFVEWCESDLMDALDEMGITDKELDSAMRAIK